jgi:hypothetical protein
MVRNDRHLSVVELAVDGVDAPAPIDLLFSTGGERRPAMFDSRDDGYARTGCGRRGAIR